MNVAPRLPTNTRIIGEGAIRAPKLIFSRSAAKSSAPSA
jgi:hypothetical protein